MEPAFLGSIGTKETKINQQQRSKAATCTINQIYHSTQRRTMGGLNPVANATSYLSVVLCDGSSRKLIAGWWYVFYL
jgi:hypothetical protein